VLLAPIMGHAFCPRVSSSNERSDGLVPPWLDSAQRAPYVRAVRPLPRVLLLIGALSGACMPARAPQDPALDASRHRAALATIVVDNRTTQSLLIAFRPAIAPGGEVVVGRVPAGTQSAVAPVPAQEPILLRARRATGEELELPARSFEMDAEWVWVIPVDASFTMPATPPQ
jgi:hypothetical protein